MKILLLGKNGQVGFELQRSLSLIGCVTALGREETDPNYCGDLNHPEGLRNTVRRLSPDVIVNAAAFTKVDEAEGVGREKAVAVNEKGVANLANLASEVGALLVHYSTDYVYDGSGVAPWKETDTTNPCNFYGQTKLAGDLAIAASGCNHFIFRTSWIYSTRGSNFLRTMLRLTAQMEQVSVIEDQFGAPTSASLVAFATAIAIRDHGATLAPQKKRLHGTYNLTANGETSWYAYACLLATLAKNFKCSVIPSSSKNYPGAARPANSRLDTSKFESTFGLKLPDWELGVRLTMEELGYKQ